jgi:starvation-inducible DNA-binding protein
MNQIMHQTRNSMPEKDRIELSALLNQSLADTIDLYNQAKQAHWNIKGQNFIGLHKLLDDIAEGLVEQVDTIAERVTGLGGTAYGTTQQVGKATQLRVYPLDIFAINDHINHLSHNIAILAETTRTNIDKTNELDDFGTNDLYIDLVRFLDKQLWFLEAHIQK